MRPCAVIPAYQNARTLPGVVRGVTVQGLAVIVVDDGSSDGVAASLAAAGAGDGEVEVLRHERNRGKGAALRTGFERAHARGFTHALALDADGQHLPEDAPRLLEAAAAEPGALVIGARDLAAAGAGKGSRFGCAFSNFWTWVETGLRLPDTQSGYRCYPLAPILDLHLALTGYDFEVEVLVRAAWTGVPVRSVPISVRYFRGAERVSHFRPVRDFLRIGWLNTRLVTARICLPAPYLALHSRRVFRALPFSERLRMSLFELFVREPGSPLRVASSAALGLFFGIAPLWGFQIAITLWLAHVFNASKTIALLAANVSFPLVIPLILYASLVLGRALLGVPDAGVPKELSALTRADLHAYLAGSVALAVGVAAAGFVLVYAVVRALRGPGRTK